MTEPFNTTSALGELFLHIMAAFAQFERSLVRERSIAGQVEAIQQGVRFGSPSNITPELVETFRQLKADGMTYKEIAKLHQCSARAVSVHARGLGFTKRGRFPVLSRHDNKKTD